MTENTTTTVANPLPVEGWRRLKVATSMPGTTRRFCRKWVVAGLLCLMPWLGACEEKTYAVGIRGYNHTDQVIGQFQINGGSGGSFLAPHSGGGSLACCVTVPATWRSGLKITVSWLDGKFENEQERVVEMPAFTDETAGYFSVHFLRTGEVKVFSTKYDLWHPDYPLKDEEAELTPGVTPTGPWSD